VDVRVARAAGEARWVLSFGELRSLGLTSEQVEGRVRAGVLHRIHRGVYAYGRPELSFEGACRAALLASGPAAAISHGSAARLWNLRGSIGAIHLTVPRSRDGHPGLIVHRPRTFPLADMVEREGLEVTTVARTLLDLAAREPLGRVEQLLHEAGVQRVLDVHSIHETCARNADHRGRRKLEAALHAEVAPSRSGLERAFLELCQSGGLPAPVVNGHLWTGDRLEEVDFHWPSARLVVEVDGARYHSSRWRRRRDAEKTLRLEAANWRVRRFSELEITLDASAVLVETARLRRWAGESVSETDSPAQPPE